jgi:hypothetical protein
MVIAWILLASTGILIARYFKDLMPNTEIFGVKIWFIIHRPIMILVTAISITAFIVILAGLEWKWVSPDDKLEFTHSIFGIVTISVSILQVI